VESVHGDSTQAGPLTLEIEEDLERLYLDDALRAEFDIPDEMKEILFLV